MVGALMDARTIVLDDSHGDVLVVDLSGATFLDSSILGALLEARRQALERGLGYVVSLGEQPEPGVQRILEITGLVPVFPVMRSLEEALGAARSTPADAA